MAVSDIDDSSVEQDGEDSFVEVESAKQPAKKKKASKTTAATTDGKKRGTKEKVGGRVVGTKVSECIASRPICGILRHFSASAVFVSFIACLSFRTTPLSRGC